jgi:hypothetical protein
MWWPDIFYGVPWETRIWTKTAILVLVGLTILVLLLGAGMVAESHHRSE